MEWWAVQELMITSAIILAVLIPVAGFTLRFAIKPFLRDSKELRQPRSQSAELPHDSRLDHMEEQLEGLESSMRRLLEVAEFDHQLKSGTPPEGGS